MTTDDIKRNLIHFRYRISHAISKGQICYEEPPNCRGHAQVTKLLTLPIEDFQHQSPAPESLSPSAILVGSIGAPTPVTTAMAAAEGLCVYMRTTRIHFVEEEIDNVWIGVFARDH